MDTNSRQLASAADRVAANVHTLRRLRGFTLADLSDRVGERHPMSVTTLSKLERGDRGVDVDDLEALATALGVATTDLLAPAALAAEDQVIELLDQWREVMRKRVELVRDLDNQAKMIRWTIRDIVADDEDALAALEDYLHGMFPSDSHWPASLLDSFTEQGDE